MATTDVGNTFCHSATTIEMNDHHSPGALRDMLFDKRIVDLEGVDIWLYQYWNQTTIGDSKNCCYIGVGRNNNFVALFQFAKFYISTKHEAKGIKTIATRHTMARANIFCILFFERLYRCSLQIPSATNNVIYSTTNFLAMHICYSL